MLFGGSSGIVSIAHDFLRAASAISPDSTFIIATNLHKGLDWYKIMPDKLKKMSTSCEIQSPGSNIPLPVLFIYNSQATIMGTSKGYAVIFEAKHGKRVQALKHGGGEFTSSFQLHCSIF